ncbi:MAG: TetR/AcrR family transcriptional regulator [Rhizobiaceae bacterium]
MSRNREYDETQVLAGAMDAFRRKGYAGVSVRDLEAVTGLTSGSIYNAFGDKEGLFRAAFHFYVVGFVYERLERFAGPAARLENLEELYLSIFRPPLDDGFGCLVTNSMIEFGPVDTPASQTIDEVARMLSAAIGGVLVREIGQGASASMTQRLILLYHGLLVMSRARRLDGAVEKAISTQFAELRAQRAAHLDKN